MRDLIIDIQSLLDAVIGGLSYEGKPITFAWGDQRELMQWIVYKDKNIQALRAISEDANKYPLVWLTPTKVEKTDSEFRARVTLIFAQITQPEWLNDTRWKRTMPFLTEVANYVLNWLHSSRYFQIVDFHVDFEFMPNYSTTSGSDNEALDVWDAIVVDFDLLIKPNCIELLRQPPDLND